MRVVVLQSNYLPWLGYFELINSTDVFVFLDNVQWTRSDWRNRNRIRTATGWKWLTIPVKIKKPRFECSINEVRIEYAQKWQKHHLGAIRNYYAKARNFDIMFPILEKAINKKHKFIVDLNYDLIFEINRFLGLNKTKFLFSQDMDIPDRLDKTDRLLFIFDRIGNVNTYVSGSLAKTYLNENKLKEKGMGVEWFIYKSPYYDQNLWGSKIFIKNLSVVDILFCHGKDSLAIASGETIVEHAKDILIAEPDEYGAPNTIYQNR